MIKHKPKGRGACPTWFWAHCRTAARGGNTGYHSAGYDLARTLDGLAPDDVEDHKWAEEVVGFAELVSRDDNQAILGWLEIHLPRCLAMVPTRRRDGFLTGLYRAVEDGSASF
jgi:hypothetical protein